MSNSVDESSHDQILSQSKGHIPKLDCSQQVWNM